MQFTTARVSIFALFFSTALSTPLPAPAEGDPNANIPPARTVGLTGQKVDNVLQLGPEPVDVAARSLEKRGAIIVVLGIAGTAALTKVTEIAIELAADTIKNLGEWNDAREQFTQATTAEMWARNPDYARFPAVACYNKAYSLQDPALSDGLVSMKFELGLLNTDYDCMFIASPNQFYTESDGGFINLSYTYDESRCSFDEATGDLTCN